MIPENELNGSARDDASEPTADNPDSASATHRDMPAGSDSADAPANESAAGSGAAADEALDAIMSGAASSEESMAGESDDSAETLHDKLVAAEARADENWDRLLRFQADVENQRKRAQKELANARKFALESFINDLLPVKDSLEMGINASMADDTSVQQIREGSELTLKMLASALEKHQVVEVNPVDEKFDPEFHQAMSMQSVEGKAPNTVTAVMQKGYLLNDRLIRPALVMVSK